MTDNMCLKLKIYCKNNIPLSTTEINLIDKYFEVINLKRKEFLLRDGKICNFITFIAIGTIRHFHIKDGVEKTCDISFENSWVTDFQSFTHNTSCIMNLQAMEDTTVFIVRKVNLYKLYHECNKYEIFGRIMAEQVALRATEIAMSLSSYKPEERFQNLLNKQPDLFQRVPQKYIANFLGVSPESLGRIAALTTIGSLIAQSQSVEISKVKSFEHQLDDVMELRDTTELKVKLKEVEENYKLNPNEITQARLGIICHETALNLSFFSKTEYKGYAQKSYEILSTLLNSPITSKELFPFLASYRASALSLVAAETRKLKLLRQAFILFNDAVKTYASVSYLPEFLRGSVAENLPWFFFSKKKVAKQDFQSIIDKQDKNKEYANWKIMSFTYWAWAKQRQSNKYRVQALSYLDKAIASDPNYKAGRQRAEELKTKISN